MVYRKRFTRTGAAAWGARKVAKKLGYNARKQKGAAIVARSLSKALATATGRGDYYARGKRIATTGRTSGTGGRVRETRDAIYVTRTEYVTNFAAGNQVSNGVTLFNKGALRVQPGMNKDKGVDNGGGLPLFGWLPGLAQNFQEYEFTKLIIEYKPTTAEGTEFNVGKIMIGALYDNTADDFVSEYEMLNSVNAKSCRPCDPVAFGVECKRSLGSGIRKTRSNPLTLGNDPYKIKNINDFDHCKVILASVGIPGANASAVLGDIYVHYTVKLMKFKVPDKASATTYMANQNILASTLFQVIGGGAQIFGQNRVQRGNFVVAANNVNANTMNMLAGSELSPTLESPLVLKPGELPFESSSSWRIFLNNDDVVRTTYKIEVYMQGGVAASPLAPPYFQAATNPLFTQSKRCEVSDFLNLSESNAVLNGGPILTNGDIDYNPSGAGLGTYMGAIYYIDATGPNAELMFSYCVPPSPSGNARSVIIVSRVPSDLRNPDGQFVVI